MNAKSNQIHTVKKMSPHEILGKSIQYIIFASSSSTTEVTLNKVKNLRKKVVRKKRKRCNVLILNLLQILMNSLMILKVNYFF